MWTGLRADNPGILVRFRTGACDFSSSLTASRLCLGPSHCTVHCLTLDVYTEVNRPARGADLHVVRGQGVFVAMLPFRMCLPGVHSDNFIFTELMAPAAVT
jgi:hypothetical protein